MTLGTRSSGLRRLIASVVCVADVNGYASAAELNVLGTLGS